MAFIVKFWGREGNNMIISATKEVGGFYLEILGNGSALAEDIGVFCN